MLRPRLPRIALNLRRAKHHVAPLDHFRDGIPGLYDKESFEKAYTEYQGLMIMKLNALTAGSPDDFNSTTKTILLKYARQPNLASLFNHASMAHNNHFFFSCLSNENQEMPLNLIKQVEESFSSVETLKRDLIATANSMFGPGFVWLVRTNNGVDRKLAILTTYIAGSPYPGAHYRKQARDLNTEADLQNPADAARKRALDNLPVVNTVGSHGPLSAVKNVPGGIDVVPILCVSTWEHSYLHFGVMRKKQFLEAWWDRIDWNVVANRLGENQGKLAYMT